ncbi:MAG: amino acid ABC transporter permease [Alphaproteobacteria bacterium]|nr:amino acid ABC transporter permease [Alphaproteobacteria bacterium]
MLLLEAMGTTLAMTAIGCVLGFLIAFVIVFLRQTPGLWALPIRFLAICYVEVFRRIPFLVVIYLVLFFIRSIVSEVSLFTIAVVAICIYSTAYTADIIRGGFESVSRQQIEAARAMNFSRWQTLMNVIVPQSWPVILPPAVAFAISFIKDTALVSQVGVFELTFRGKELNNEGFSALLVFGTIAFLYFLMSYPLSRWGRWLEQRLASSPSQRSKQRLRPAYSP